MTQNYETGFEKPLLGNYLSGSPIGEGITADCFTSEANAVIFKTIAALKAKGLTVNIALLATELEKRNLLEKVGGYGEVASLTNDCCPANTAFFEREILNAHRRRQALKAVAAAKEALERQEAPDEIIARMKTELEKTNIQTAKAAPILFADLLKKRFPPKQFFIERILTPGLTVFSGASKSGKSWLCLQLAQALDAGGGFMGTLRAEKTTALYFSLEDGQEAIYHRLQKQGNTAFQSSYLATEKMTFKELSDFLDRHSETKVIVVDTWQKFAAVTDSNDYSENVLVASRLKEIADKHGAAIIVITHLRKSSVEGGDHLNETLGSIGLVATADSTWTLRRRRGENTARFFASGRNIEDAEFSLRWDRDLASWAVESAGELKPALPEAQRQVIDLLESEEREFTTSEIAETTGKSDAAVSNILKRLLEDGAIGKPERGKWASLKFTFSHPPRECENVNFPPQGENAPEPVPEAPEEVPIW
ncbi:MAG: AAA family ATPase [Treponematales bacterium]